VEGKSVINESMINKRKKIGEKKTSEKKIDEKIDEKKISGKSPTDKRPRILLGMFQQLPVPAISRYLAQQGWDWLILDMQHGSFDYSTAYECCHVARQSGSKPLVRVPIGDFSAIQRVLDLGAFGVVVPMVNSREEAEQAAQAAKYPPLGGRSRGGDAWYHFGANYTETANSMTVLLVQIEHIKAVALAEKILAVEGVDGFLMGQVDLALSMGLSDTHFSENREHQAAIQHTVDVCNSLGKLACYNAFSEAEAQERVRQGFHVITYQSDVDVFCASGRARFDAMRRKLHLPERA
jgi:4-hydroxy-2-oxoheptanedioate aldolase